MSSLGASVVGAREHRSLPDRVCSRADVAKTMNNSRKTARPPSPAAGKGVRLILVAALACAAISAQARPANAQATSAQVVPAVEPQAVAALTRMSAYLRTIPAFQITLRTQRDDVDVYGQLITLSGGATYSVRRPNAFFIDLSQTNMAAKYVYDGSTVTVYDGRTNAYARVQAPSTIGATLALAEERYGATVPLDDLFTWSEGDARASALTSAHFIGQSQIAGTSANHYAFRQPGRDWQIWIQDGDRPLPLRVSVVASDDPARPRFEADLSWNTAPTFAANTFVFAPPPNARAVDVARAN